MENVNLVNKEWNIRGAVLSYMPFTKEKFISVVRKYEDITEEKAQAIWNFLADQTGQAYDSYRLSQKSPEPLTRESLAEVEFDRSGWDTFARELDLDGELADALFEEYQDHILDFAEEQFSAQEKAQEEAEQAQESQQTGEGEEGRISKEQAQLLLTKIMNDKSHPYWSDQATQQEHELAVAGVLRLREIIAGVATTLDGYAEQHYAEKEQKLKEDYGVSGNVYKTGAYGSSNKVKGSRSEEQPDVNPDSIAQGGESSSNVGGSENESEDSDEI